MVGMFKELVARLRARRIARLRAKINAPAYYKRRLEKLCDMYSAATWAWQMGRHRQQADIDMKRINAKIDRAKSRIRLMEAKEERDRIHRKYEKSLP